MFNYRNPGIWTTVFSSGSWLCCTLLTFILNLSTWVFHFFGKAAGGIFEHLPISHGITPHLLRELAPLIWACPFIHCAGTWFKSSIYQNLHHWTLLQCSFHLPGFINVTLLGNSFIALTWKISFEHQVHIMCTKWSAVMQLN